MEIYWFVLLLVSDKLRQVVFDVNLMGAVRQTDFDATCSEMAWETMEKID